MNTIREYKLPKNTYRFANGFRIVYEKSKNEFPVTYFDVFCDVGSVYETDDVRGASHFIEHMVFKGTKKLKTSIDVIRSYDNVGAYFNATTTQRYTKYIIKCPDNSFEELIDILSDILFNSVFNKIEYKKEKNVVIEENLSSDNEDLIWDMTTEMNYKGTPFEYPVDHIKYHTKQKESLNYEKIIDFYERFYQPNNMVLSITTNIPFIRIINILKKTFFYKKISQNKHENECNKSIFYIQPKEKSQIEYNIKSSNNDDVTYMHLSFMTLPMHSDEQYKIKFLSTILGGYFSSRLFVLLRENNGLTYSSYSDVNFNEITGDITIGVKSNPTKLIKNGGKKGVLPLIINMLNELHKNGTTEKEIELTKNYLKGSMNSNLEKNSLYTSYNGSFMLLYSNKRDYVPYEDLYKKYYENITVNEVNETIKKYLIKSRLNVCVLGKNLPSQNSIKKECEKLIV